MNNNNNNLVQINRTINLNSNKLLNSFFFLLGMKPKESYYVLKLLFPK